MSTRDNQKKYDDKSNVDSSIYSRVNIGQGANNKFDGPNLTHSGGSMNNPDEQVHHRSSSLTTVHLLRGRQYHLRRDSICRDADFSRLLLWRGSQQVTPFSAVTTRIFGYRIFLFKIDYEKICAIQKEITH